MFEVHIWNDLQGDFIVARGEDRKPRIFERYEDAQLVAMEYLARGVQARVEYIRNRFIEKRTKKTMKAGPISRSFIRNFDGRQVIVTHVFNSKGRRVSK